MLLRHLKVFAIAALFAAIAYGLVNLLFLLTRGWF
jgi:hypothetical protein